MNFSLLLILQPWLAVLQVISAIAVIILVLLQQGKGADMGAAFGSGSAGSIFGAAGAANFFSRMTKWCAIVFFASTLMLAYAGNGGRHNSNTTGTENTGLMQGYQSTPAAPETSHKAQETTSHNADIPVAPNTAPTSPEKK